MFHELWIGGVPTSRLKDRAVGRIQRHYIQKLTQEIKPRSVTTSNPFYVALLESIGVRANELPLFGNIPVGPPPTFRFQDRSQALFFGSLYPEWKAEPFMSIWIAASAKTQKRPHLATVGRLGASGEVVWKKLQKTYGHAVQFGIPLPDFSVPAISEFLQLADFGLATSPWSLIGKSGSVAAMLEHGLPVIVTRDDVSLPVPFPGPHDPLLHRCDDALELKLLVGLPKRPPHDRLKEVARDFLGILDGN